MPLPRLPNLVARELAPSEPSQEGTEVASIEPQPSSPAAAPPSLEAVEVTSVSAEAARTELTMAGDRTGLDDAQLRQISDAQQLIERGDAQTALTRLKALNEQLDSAYGTVIVNRGENLWQIASRPETYGNPYLWPLIWRTNITTIEQPWDVQRGQKLLVPKYPHLQDVSSALEYSHSHGPDGRKPPPEAASAAAPTP